MKYHALLSANQGLNKLPLNPCKLLDFSLLKLAAGETYSAETPEREILAVILGGKATFEVNGKRFEKVGGRPNVFAGKPHSVYIPVGAKFTIQGRRCSGDRPAQCPQRSEDRTLPHRSGTGSQWQLGCGQLQASFPPDPDPGFST